MLNIHFVLSLNIQVENFYNTKGSFVLPIKVLISPKEGI